MKKLWLAAPMLFVATAAYPQQGATVESLVKDGYEIKAVIPSNAGPGFVLQKGNEVTMCFVAETPDSDAVTTQYCKPVR